jgi:hypothetical protein
LFLPIKITTEIPHSNLKNGPDGSTAMEGKYTELSNTRDKKGDKADYLCLMHYSVIIIKCEVWAIAQMDTVIMPHLKVW